MPKIPLYNQQSGIGTASGVSINSSAAINLADAQSAADQSITNGIFQIMEETLGAGQDYLQKKKEDQERANKNKMNLAEIDVDVAIEKERSRLINEGYDETYIFNEIVNNKFADKWLEGYVKDNKIVLNQDLEDQWALKTAGIEKRELISFAKFEDERNQDSIKNYANKLINSDQFEEAIAFVNAEVPDGDKAREILSSGLYSRIQGQLMTATSIEQADAILAEAEKYATSDTPYLGASSFQGLKVQYKAALARISSTITAPAIKEARELFDKGELSINSETFRRLPLQEQLMYLERFDREREGAMIATLDPETQENAVDTANGMVSRLLSGKYTQEDFDAGINTSEEMIDAIYELIQQREPDAKGDPKGDFIIPPFLQDEILAPITWARSDSDTVDIFLPDARFAPNRKDSFVKSSYEMYLDAYQSAASNLNPRRRINLNRIGLQIVQNTIEDILKNPKDFEGVKVEVIGGRRYVTGYEKHMEKAINNVLAPLRTTVADEQLKRFFIPDMMYEVARGLDQESEFSLRLTDEEIATQAVAPTLERAKQQTQQELTEQASKITGDKPIPASQQKVENRQKIKEQQDKDEKPEVRKLPPLKTDAGASTVKRGVMTDKTKMYEFQDDVKKSMEEAKRVRQARAIGSPLTRQFGTGLEPIQRPEPKPEPKPKPKSAYNPINKQFKGMF